MNNAVQEAVWTGIGSMLSHAWPILVLLLLLNLAKPYLKKRGKNGRSSTGRKPVGFLERVMPKAAGSQEPFKASDTLPKALTKRATPNRNYSEVLMEQGDAYVAKKHLMTSAERQFYKVLEKVYGECYYVFCQVRVVDVIQPNTKIHSLSSREYTTLFRQLSQWHFDFLLCKKEDFSISCAIELDDKTHLEEPRIKRDRILEASCKNSGIKLIRFKTEDIHKLIEKNVLD